jgi:hypothetical protein
MNKMKILKKLLLYSLVVDLIILNNIVGICGEDTNTGEDVYVPQQNIALLHTYSPNHNNVVQKQLTRQTTPFDTIIDLQNTGNEPPVILWNKTYGGEENDTGKKIRKTADGYIILGYTSSFGAANPDFWLLKTDINGNEVWNHTYGTTLDEYGMDVQQTSDGGYILVGYYFFYGTFNQGFRLVKTTATGVEQWNKTFGDTSHPASACSIYQTSDTGYLILGSNWTNPDNLYIIKTDGNGNKIWEKHLSSPAGIFYDSKKTNDGGFIITGSADTNGHADLYLMKIDADYNKQWDIVIGSDLFDAGLSVIQTQDSGYVALGVADAVDGLEGGDIFLVKIDAQGAEVWNRTLWGADTQIGWSVAETIDGYIFVGSTRSYTDGDINLLIGHTDSQGVVDEYWSLGGHSYDEAFCVLVDSEGDYIITGHTASFTTGSSSDLWLLKIQQFEGNLPPTQPTIEGPTSGFYRESHQWNITAMDPNNDDINFFIDWGDGTTTGWSIAYPSGETMTQSHKYKKQGTYTIKAKAKDPYNQQSDWGTLVVTMPYSVALPIMNLWEKLFQRFPNAFPLVRHLLGF